LGRATSMEQKCRSPLALIMLHYSGSVKAPR
jgi:hypothetical protein